MIFVIIPLTILVLVLSFTTYNLLVKNEAQEDMLETQMRFMNMLNIRIGEVINEMRLLDSRGVFEADDEVGNVFKQLLECTEQLVPFVTEISDGDTPTQEKQ